MTDAAAALADTSSLPDYQGKPVVRTTISVRSAGDGLSEGMGIEPQLLDIGSTVYVVLECKVTNHNHGELKDALNLMALEQVLKAGTAVIIDADVVKTAIAEQAERIDRAKDAAAGRVKLPYPDELAKQHDEGEHASGLVEGCPQCDDEVRVKAAEEADTAGDDTPPEPTPIGKRRKGA